MSSPQLLAEQARRWTQQKQVSTTDNTSSVIGLKQEVEKLKKEEARYVKAYGGGIINEEQLQEVMNDLKMRRAVLEREIGHIQGEVQKTDIIVTPDENQIYKFSEAAKSQLNDLSFEAKRRIILKVVDTIIGQQRLLRVRGYLPILLRKEDENVKFWSECRNCWFAKCGEIYAV